MHSTARSRKGTRGARMTIKVYTISADGSTRDRGTVCVTNERTPTLLVLGAQLPPCECPLHRAGLLR
jgi:hypothetical protein